jgi:hypothetical protein
MPLKPGTPDLHVQKTDHGSRPADRSARFQDRVRDVRTRWHPRLNR